MSDITEMLADIDAQEFTQGFLDVYLRDGFASLPKRQIDLLVLELLLSHKATWKAGETSDYSIGRLLSMSPRRVRSMLDEIAFRDDAKDDEWCREQLTKELTKAEKLFDKGKVRIQINDGLVRAYATAEIQRALGIVDFSFNRAVITLSGERYAALIIELLEEGERELLLSQIPNLTASAEKGANANKSLVRLFVESFVEGAGDEAGRKTIQLGSALLSGGATAAIDLIKDTAG